MTDQTLIKRLSQVGIFGNIFLSAFKLFAGILGHSGAMISDAVHSLSDVIATLIALIGVLLSRQSADDRHPYGHERFECVASLILGLILAATGLGIGYSGVIKILGGHLDTIAIPTMLPLLAAVVSIVSKEAMFWYTLHYADKMNSPAFRADAWHHRSDALSSIGSFIGIGAARLGYPVMEPLASIVICLFILKAAYDIFMDALNKMLDTSCSPELNRALTDFITAQADVISLDLLHTRQFGSRMYVDVEIAVDPGLSLIEAHGIAERIHDALEENWPDIKHVMIHVNPYLEH